jgi:adenylosuccinate synthase
VSKIQVVVGGQFGSEGKGAIAGHLARVDEESGFAVYGVRVAGPNAGHTVYGRCPWPLVCDNADCRDNPKSAVAFDSQMHPWKLRSIPVAAVTAPNSALIIAAGSEIDPQVLDDETMALNAAGYDVSSRLYVDRSATVITDDHKDQEATRRLTAKIGSTGKGIGAARAERIWRQADLFGGRVDTGEILRSALRQAGVTVQIEGTQGFGLGLHGEFYPHCTSSDARAIDFLAMAGISPWMSGVRGLDVWVVARTYPIRVAGNSGELQDETSWANLGLPAERTTVTNKVRRVGGWDVELVRKAIDANGGINSPSVHLAITMLDYIDSDAAGATTWDRVTDVGRTWLREEVQEQLGIMPSLLGTGPTTVVRT